jgi:hypothetical protein
MRTDMLDRRRQLMEDWSTFVAANSTGTIPRIAEKTGDLALATPKTTQKTGKSAPKPLEKRQKTVGKRGA